MTLGAADAPQSRADGPRVDRTAPPSTIEGLARHQSLALSIHDAVQFVCERLPEHYAVTIDMELGAGSITLFGTDGDQIEIEDYDPSDDSIEHGLVAAVGTATKRAGQ